MRVKILCVLERGEREREMILKFTGSKSFVFASRTEST